MTALAVQTPPRAPWSVDDLDVLAGGDILGAFHAAERLRESAATERIIREVLFDLLDDGDQLARMLSLRALSATPGSRVDAALSATLDDPDLAEHAAWALGDRPTVAGAVPLLVRLVAVGGFTAMPAQLALERWGGKAGVGMRAAIRKAIADCPSDGGWSRLSETLALMRQPTPPSPHKRPATAIRHGLRVAQILLRGQVDADLGRAGAGDGGGVVTLLVQLAAELGRRDDVERSLILARRRAVPTPSREVLGPGAAILRLPFGPDEDVPVHAMWEHRAKIERAIAELLRVHGPMDVAHLRYADAGTFAAARACRRARVPVVFTVAPDPHALIAERERAGDVTRASFADAEASDHSLFRLRLVDDLARTADRLVTLPRSGGRVGLEQLLTCPLPTRRTTTVAEGIALAPIEQARRAVAEQRPATIVNDLHSAIEGLGPERLGLPLIVSAGRFHPVKGFPRLVEAWAGDPELARRFNLVLIGGDFDRPTGDEQSVLADIERVASAYGASATGLVLLGSRPHDDVARVLAVTRHGWPGTAAPNGLYACASGKEEFGVALLEALACGLTVVAPAGGGPGTYVEHGVTGVLVRPGRVDTLRAGLRAAAELAEDERRAARAEALVRERFSIGPMSAALADAYARAAAA
jgi:glycosyltransferase involved in cell wall biosynthesis